MRFLRLWPAAAPLYCGIAVAVLGLPSCADAIRDAIVEANTPVEQPDEPDGALGPVDEGDVTAPGPLTPVVEPAEPLAVLSIEPADGLTSGLTEVVLVGTGFERGLEVLFGQAPGSDIFVLTPETAILLTPPHPAGLVDVAVRHPDYAQGAPQVLEDAFRFYTETTVASVEPDEGDARGGEPITIRGSGFAADTKAFIDGRQLIAPSVVGDGTINGLTPPGRAGERDVTVVTRNSTLTRPRAYRYRTAPTIERVQPLQGPEGGGTLVRIHGAGLSPDTTVLFGDAVAEVVERAPMGEWIDVAAPAGSPGELADVSVATGWGVAVAPGLWSWYGEETDPFVLACHALHPTSGPREGGTLVSLGCLGLQYGVDVRVGDREADIVDLDAETGVFVVRTPEGDSSGPADVLVTTPFDSVVAGTFLYEPEPDFAVTSVDPAFGPPEGGTPVSISGVGFNATSTVRIGALAATSVEYVDANTITAVTPAGSPGPATVTVSQNGAAAELPGAFDYGSDELGLDLALPAWVARAGNTRMRILGSGFADGADVFIGDEPCAEVQVVARGEIVCRSPALTTGLHDVTVLQDGETVALADAITCYDPLSGYGGTWGGTIDGTINVAVVGTNGYGPIAGATVIIQTEDGVGWQGMTDATGQVTASEPGLHGPVTVTGAHPEFDAYSVVHFDAINVTVYLRPKVPPTGGGLPEGIGPAVLSGRVLGLEKYVPAVPGSCDLLNNGDGFRCGPCDPLEGCADEELACVDLGITQGTRCLLPCETSDDCDDGFVCMGVDEATRCAPDPGQRTAKCYVSRTSPFSQEPGVSAGGWVEPGEMYEISSERLGEMAVICFAGYLRDSGEFIPTIMGVRRHVFAEPDATITGLDVELQYRLDHDARLRFVDPPTWPTGVRDPQVTLSLEIGPEGWIPFSRPLIKLADDHWLAPYQLVRTTGELQGASYQLYASMTANTSTSSPRSYYLLQAVDRPFEDRLPVYTEEGWMLEETQIDGDLHAITGATADRLVAVGENGRILRYNGSWWTAQGSPTHRDLRALAQRGDDDIYAVGDVGTVLHWTGLAWEPIEAPVDDYHAAATAAGQPLLVAGRIRVRSYDGSTWQVEGPPSLQRVRALSMASDGTTLAVGDAGRAHLRDAEGGWTDLALPTTQGLRGAWLSPDGAEFVAVGSAGTLIAGPTSGPFEAIDLATGLNINAITAGPDGVVTAVGDRGLVVTRDTGGAWSMAQIPDYRGRALAVVAPDDGSATRVVGSVDMVIGPFVHFPIITAPVHDDTGGALSIAWSSLGGVPAAYNRVLLAEETGRVRWVLVVDGAETRIDLPDLPALAGFGALGSGRKRVEVTRVANPDFDIDLHSTRDFSIYRRDSWSVGYAEFTSPE